jgi:hypothetical protein
MPSYAEKEQLGPVYGIARLSSTKSDREWTWILPCCVQLKSSVTHGISWYYLRYTKVTRPDAEKRSSRQFSETICVCFAVTLFQLAFLSCAVNYSGMTRYGDITGQDFRGGDGRIGDFETSLCVFITRAQSCILVIYSIPIPKDITISMQCWNSTFTGNDLSIRLSNDDSVTSILWSYCFSLHFWIIQ